MWARSTGTLMFLAGGIVGAQSAKTTAWHA